MPPTKTFQLKLTPDFREELEAAAERDGFKQGQLGTWMKWVLAQYAQKTLTLRPIKKSQKRIR